VIGGAALFGAASGAGTLARPALLAEYYGAAHYGSISGVLAFFLSGAQALAPVGAGLLYTLFGGYQPVLWIIALVFGVGFVAVVRLSGPRQMDLIPF
jgi:MFS family permease